ncbi:unnamed protein product [Lupinus luteus]|uniref:non-specific serine/threonine protein kinase n=1 Tax=Lupinus luteus TaxID=3873 RepID=A0AAV1Y8P4_LUPLU
MNPFIFNLHGTEIWSAFLITSNVILRAIASTPLELEMEASAILNSGWWNISDYNYNDISSLCEWNGISCNHIGSITKIKCPCYLRYEKAFHQFSSLKLSAFQNLERLDLWSCGLGGSIPFEIGNLTKLTFLVLSHNFLNGEIPFSIENLGKITTIDLNHNLISGEIPPQLGYLPNLNTLDLSDNNLYGMVPQSLVLLLQNKSEPVNLFLSYNNLKGPIPYGLPPYTLLGNKDVLVPRKKKPIYQQAKILPILICSIASFLILVCVMLIHNATKKKHAKPIATKNGDLFSIWNYDGHIAYEDIIKETEGFDMKYCVGTGAYGCVYKVPLPNGKVVALKKLHGFVAEDPTADESFRSEVDVLSKIKHRHIVKLLGFCMHKRIRFLIYEYMEKGSLFSVLYDDVEAIELEWRKRVNIIKGIAHALSYLHHDCIPPIVHRDISSSNILLNSEWEPNISDFGTARLLKYDCSNRTIVAGTYGYIAPEISDQSCPLKSFVRF